MSKLLDLEINYLRFLKNINKFSGQDRKTVIKAYKFAKKSHARQRRDEGPLFIIHPLRMANILMSELKIYDPIMVSALLLHDVVEDTAIKMSKIKSMFGNKIYKLVSGLTRYRPQDESESQKIKNKKKNYKKIMKSDETLRLLKAIDNLDNLRSYKYIPKNSPSRKKFSRWINEIKLYYLPLSKITNKYIYKEIQKASREIKKLG